MVLALRNLPYSNRLGLKMDKSTSVVSRSVKNSAISIGLVLILLLVHKLSVDDPAFPTSWRLPLRDGLDIFADWVVDNLTWFFNPIGEFVSFGLRWVERSLIWLSWPVVILAVFLLASKVASPRIGLLSVVGLLFMGAVGLWEESMQTLSLMAVSVFVSAAIGILLGIFAARSDTFEATIRPILDGMQTMPVFVYLIPVVLLFGFGDMPSVIATIIYATPPTIRLTNLGIRHVAPDVLEVAKSFGSTPLQTLIKVQLPLAKPSIMMGINQTIMMALGVVVIAAMIGAGGLGRPVWSSVRRLEFGQALEGGLAIVFMAIIMDRISYALGKKENSISDGHGRDFISLTSGMQRFQGARALEHTLSIIRNIFWLPQAFGTSLASMLDFVTRALGNRVYKDKVQPFLRHNAYWLTSFTILLILLAINHRVVNFGDFPEWGQFSLRGSFDTVVDWININFSSVIDPARDSVFLYGIKPIRQFLIWLPWSVIVVATAILAHALAGWRIALYCTASLIFIGVVDMWDEAIITMSLVAISVLLSIFIGIPLGILMAHSNRFEAFMKPILDTMQTMPTFVYLIPSVVLLGVGSAAGVFCTVIYALPPSVRLTNLGIRQVDLEIIEAAQSYGSTSLQTLIKVQLPLAKPSIMMGINQTIMMAMAMLVVTAFIGAPGLGTIVLGSLAAVEIGKGFEAGFSILLLTGMMDHITRGGAKKKRQLYQADNAGIGSRP